MIERYEHAKTQTYVIADPHGNFTYLESNIIKHLSNCIIIIAGDIGLGFYDKKYYENVFEQINNTFIEKHIYCYLIRGNHDDPKYFKEHIINFSNVKTVDDYSMISIGEENILCVGGGISIDRRVRINNDNKKLHNNIIFMKEYDKNITDEEIFEKTPKTYWADENVIFDENKLNEIIDNNININYVISHTSPNFVWKQGFNEIMYWINNDENLEKDLNIERGNLTNIYNKLIELKQIPKKWIYGHFHDHNVEKYENTEFIALQNCDFKFDCYCLII